MPNEGFHVHGAHDHAVEHATEHAGGAHGGDAADRMAGRVAVLSAVLATLGALMSFAGGDTQSRAQLYKNNAAVTKTRANDQWEYYQAKGVKHNVAELGAAIAARPEQAANFQAEAERYKKEQAEIKEKAEELEVQVRDWDERSDEALHVHHRWALGATAMQIAIALSAIALLSRRTWLLYGVAMVGAIGLLFGGLAIAGI